MAPREPLEVDTGVIMNNSSLYIDPSSPLGAPSPGDQEKDSLNSLSQDDSGQFGSEGISPTDHLEVKQNGSLGKEAGKNDESDEEDEDSDEEDDEDDEDETGSVTFEETEYFHDVMTPGYICKGYFMSFSVRQEIVQTIRSLDTHENDVFLAGYPRSGITWTQRIIAVLRDGPKTANNADYDLTYHFPFIEYYDIFNEPLYDGFDLFMSKEPPRVVKTHLPFELVPKSFADKGKLVIILRNPKDMIVSYYNLMRNLTMVNYEATFEEFFQVFKDKHAPYGDWFKWVMSWWRAHEEKSVKNIHFLVYEKLFINTGEEVTKLANYLGYPIKEGCLGEILDAIGIQNMQKTVSFNGIKNFIRRGGIGGWKKLLTQEMSDWIDEKLQTELYDQGFPYKFIFEETGDPESCLSTSKTSDNISK